MMIDKCAVKDCPNTAIRKIKDRPYCEECGLELENEENPEDIYELETEYTVQGQRGSNDQR